MYANSTNCGTISMRHYLELDVFGFIRNSKRIPRIRGMMRVKRCVRIQIKIKRCLVTVTFE